MSTPRYTRSVPLGTELRLTSVPGPDLILSEYVLRPLTSPFYERRGDTNTFTIFLDFDGLR